MRKPAVLERIGDVIDARLETTQFTGRDVARIQLVLAVLAANRAFDYAWGAPGGRPVVELMIDAQAWAGLFGLVAWLILVGKSARVHVFVWAGHVIGAVSYGLLALSGLIHIASQPAHVLVSWWPQPMWWLMCSGFLGSVLVAGRWAHARERCGGALGYKALVRAAAVITLIGLLTPLVPLDGGFAVGPLILTTVIHGLICLRMGPVPIGGALDQRIADERR